MSAFDGAAAAALIQQARQNPAPLSDWAAGFLTNMERRTAPPTVRQIERLAEIVARADVKDVARRLRERMADLTQALLGKPTQVGREKWRFRTRGSLAVEIGGPHRGQWFDHEAGERGDALMLVAHLRREPPAAALAWAQAWLGDAAGRTAQPTSQAATASPEGPREGAHSKTASLARETWQEAAPAAGTPVVTYLASRGLRLEIGAPIRFHPRAWRNSQNGPRGPAMVALMSSPETGKPCGAHVTYLRPDGSGKADGAGQKIMLGNAGVVRLVPDEDVTLGLGIAEGIETSLAVMQGFGWRPVWAATSAGAVKRFPLLAGIASLTVFADPDGPGLVAARLCATRWADAGREARICSPPAGDFNDLARDIVA